MRSVDYEARLNDFIRLRCHSHYAAKNVGLVVRAFLKYSNSVFTEKAINDYLLDLRDGRVERNKVAHPVKATRVKPSALMTYKRVLVRFSKYCNVKIKADNLLCMDDDPAGEDRIPTQFELRKLFENAGLRTKVTMALLTLGSALQAHF